MSDLLLAQLAGRDRNRPCCKAIEAFDLERHVRVSDLYCLGLPQGLERQNFGLSKILSFEAYVCGIVVGPSPRSRIQRREVCGDLICVRTSGRISSLMAFLVFCGLVNRSSGRAGLFTIELVNPFGDRVIRLDGYFV